MSSLTVTNEHYNLVMHENYAVVSYFNIADLPKSVINEVRSHLGTYYANRHFILINLRKDPVKIDPKFFKSAMPNLIGVAIVASAGYDKETLWKEQQNFKNSYAYFTSLEDAEAWASTHLLQI